MPLRTLLVLLSALATTTAADATPEMSSTPPRPPDRSTRADSTWLFAPSGLGAYGEPGTSERGYTFDGFGECQPAAWTVGGGTTVALRENDFLPGSNESCLWTFFDPALANEDYPMGIIPYGPPWVQMWIESPPLEVDAEGNPFEMAWDEGQIVLQFDVYRDLPLDPLIFFEYRVAGRGPNGDYFGFVSDNFLIYGTDGWVTLSYDVTPILYDAMGAVEDSIAGVKVYLGVIDLCGEWCNLYGSGENHTLGPLFDNVQVCVVTDPTAAPEGVPAANQLLAPHPNPFNPKTTVRFTLAERGPVGLKVVDLSGRLVRRLRAAEMEAGEHRVDWDGCDDAGRELPAGVYLLQLEAGGERLARKAVLLK